MFTNTILKLYYIILAADRITKLKIFYYDIFLTNIFFCLQQLNNNNIIIE